MSRAPFHAIADGVAVAVRLTPNASQSAVRGAGRPADLCGSLETWLRTQA